MAIALLNMHAVVMNDRRPVEAVKTTMPKRTFPSFVVGALLAVGVTTATSSTSHAASCKGFTITLDDHTWDVKMTKFEYKDEGKWKTENIFGIIGYRRLYFGTHIDYKRNLQGIKNEYTQFRVTYKKNIYVSGPSVKWGEDIFTTTDTFVCHDLGRTVMYLR